MISGLVIVIEGSILIDSLVVKWCALQYCMITSIYMLWVLWSLHCFITVSCLLLFSLSDCCVRNLYLYVWSNVPTLFLLNNSRTPWPTLFKLGPHIHPDCRVNILKFGSLGQRSWSPGLNVSKPFPISNWRTSWQTWSTHSSWLTFNLIDFGVTRSRSLRSNVPKPFPIV